MDNPGMILSVTQINEYIRSLLASDDVLSMITVRGEISNLTIHRSGHIYFTLKDENSVLKSVMFRSSAQKIKFALKEGMSVIVFGRISLYTPSGQYQLYAEAIQPDGIGALYIAYEQIKERLAKEGLFDNSKKKNIPKFPSTVGIVTSPTGAAIHDMINVIGRRFPMAKIVLYPALVQGEGAPKSLISGLEYFNSKRPTDVIIIGRGGGSMEDLWGFNDVELAYAIFKSSVPVISAVGHESDFTICDFVADLRAPTPSAAAELAVPDGLAVSNALRSYMTTINTLTASYIQGCRNHITVISSARVLSSKQDLLNEYRMKLELASERLDISTNNLLINKKHQFNILTVKLDAISPLNTLKRGFAIALDASGNTVSSVEDTKINDTLDVSFADGRIKATVNEISKTEEKICPQKKI